MDALVDLLLEWIGEKTPYVTSDMPAPVILNMTPEELVLQYARGVAQLLPTDGLIPMPYGIYAPDDGENGVIYITQPRFVPGAFAFPDPKDNPLFQEILLHELVHHVQEQSGATRNWPCHRAGELEAYELGGMFLRDAGAQDPLQDRELWGLYFSRC